MLILLVDQVNSQELSYRSAALVVSDNEQLLDAYYPRISWPGQSHQLRFADPGFIPVIVQIESRDPLQEVRILVSKDTDTLGIKVFEIYDGEEFEKGIQNNVYLSNGMNTIRVLAKTKAGIESWKEQNYIVGDEAIREAVVEGRKDRALLIATDEYDEWNDLVNPVFDARTIANELEENYGFSTELLLNPTAEEILLKLREYSTIEFKPQDQLFIFFAGHGQYEPTFGEGFVVARDSKKNDLTFSSYISHSRLSTIINTLPCEHIFITMDVCYGGAFSSAAASQRGEDLIYNDIDTDELIKRKLKFKSRMYLTSGGVEYVSDGLPGKHSPFGRKFITALRNYGGRDRVLTLLELRLFVEKIDPSPMFGEFGDNMPGGDFLFVAQ